MATPPGRGRGLLAAYEVTKTDKRFIGAHILVAVIALSIGTLFGPLQAFEHSGIDLYPYIQPIFKSYYQGLTIHGVLNALVWTTFFITGFFTLTIIYGFKRGLRYPKLNRVGFWTLVVVGSWIEGYGFFFTYRAWRKESPDTRTPFIAFGSLITMAMWQFATLGIAVEILTMLLPWSLGLIEGTDPQLARTYFWFTGHPLVYFWLLPAYVSWYGMLPRQAGGKLFSDSLARLAFWLFLVLSVPLGFHHQFVDPGIPSGWKYIHAVLTYSVFFPSMLTAFTVIASLERAARNRGGKGLLGCVRELVV